MSNRLLRKGLRIDYSEIREPNLDEYVYCDECGDFVVEYCCIHGPLLVISDEKVTNKPKRPSSLPLAILTIPKMLLHVADSSIPGAGIGVFASITLPRGLRFGPYRGNRKLKSNSSYSWQIYGPNNRASHVVDAADPNTSNWLRYVNCSRNSEEQNLVAFQYRGEIYYRTIKDIPASKELLVFYGTEFAIELNINLRCYNSPDGYSLLFGKKQDTDSTELQENNTKNAQRVNSKTNREASATYDDYDVKVTDTQTGSKVESRATSPSDHSHLLNRICRHKGESFYECTICFSGFTKHGKKCRMCKKRSKQNDKTYICDTCTKSFKRKSTLVLHIRTHTGERPYKCKTCPKRFTQSYKLKRHSLIHGGVKPFSCETCPKKFTEKSQLKRHMRIHTGDKPYICDVCDKRFTHKTSIIDHLRSHTGEKPFKCEKCNNRFRYRNNLKDHLRSHYRILHYKCETCHKGFTNKANWKIHVLSHKGIKQHKCKICHKKFSHQKSLVRHNRIHTGEKPYKCETCLRAFSHKNSLNRHTLTHTGKTPYKCYTCGRKFTHHNSYKSHFRTHNMELQFKCDICQKRFVYKSSFNRHARCHTNKVSVEM